MYGQTHVIKDNRRFYIMHVKKIKKITKKGEYIMTSESTFVEMNQEEYIDCYRNYRFDKEGMEELAKKSVQMLENYSMQRELEELEEENYYALSERYKKYSMFELIKKLFE